MTIKKIVNEERDKVTSMMLKQIVSLRWSERFVADTDDEIKNLDIEKVNKEIEELRNQLGDKDKANHVSDAILTLDTKKKKHEELKEHLDNIDKTQEGLENNALAWHDLNNCKEEVTNLLK